MIAVKLDANINVTKLYDELIATGLITPNLNDGTSRIIGQNLFLDDDTDMVLVQSVIEAHNPSPIPIISKEEILYAKIENQTLNLLIDLGVI